MSKKHQIFTIGHSNRNLEEFVELLTVHGITRLIDVRTIPRSRHNPQFNSEDLSSALKKHKVKYLHMKALGGLRHPRKDSVNLGWHNDSFRGYADYMQSPEFTSALEELVQLTREGPTAIMCAEAVPWRCHRSLIADALTVQGFDVKNIISLSSSKDHSLNPMAVVDDGRVTYPAESIHH
ncbi:MAG: DNA repair protein [Candidatus Melainabacteria bacterium]|nr:MAG: DNA repair protein [Candidatus Melainabacteria bacterium]